MLRVKFFSIIFMVFCLLPEQSKATECRQSEYPVTVYATNGTTCFLFRHIQCVSKLSDELRLAGRQGLSLTTMSDCQTKCPKNCGTQINYVCGEHGGRRSTFANECEMWKVSCASGQAIMKIPLNKCRYQKYNK